MEQLDARNLLCPMPVIKTQDRVNNMSAGDTLEVLCTDHGALKDIPMWCRINGHKVLETVDQDHQVIIRLEVGDGA